MNHTRIERIRRRRAARLQARAAHGRAPKPTGPVVRKPTLRDVLRHRSQIAVGKRVRPPTKPAGGLGGRGGTNYRWGALKRPTTSKRDHFATAGTIQVGNDLRKVGSSRCVPCAKSAQMARG